MSLRIPMLALVPAALLVAPAPAASPPPVEHAEVRFAQGDCDSLLLEGRPRTRGCKPNLVSLAYRSGLVSFVFAGKDGRHLSFLTRIERQVGQETRLKVGQVTIVTRGGAEAYASPAAGDCVLTPFAVNRSRLECSAKAGGSRYSALFRTSDAEPRIVTF
ncbi:hypothetical protein [Sphingomonas swuensis]